MKVAVGSKNPTKIKAVESAFNKVFGDCEVVSILVSSGVPAMPMSSKETVDGAKNRAREAIRGADADFGVGLESGFEMTEFGTFLLGVVAIVDKRGKWGISKGSWFLVPERIVKKVRDGKELGDVMEDLRRKGCETSPGSYRLFYQQFNPASKSF